jgi:hypothetical protein
VVSNAGLFTIAVSVAIDDEVYSIEAFHPYCLFPAKENDYFLLSL